MFGIDNIVDRVQAISWNSPVDNHMHLQFWNGADSLITWQEIDKASAGAAL